MIALLSSIRKQEWPIPVEGQPKAKEKEQDISVDIKTVLSQNIRGNPSSCSCTLNVYKYTVYPWHRHFLTHTKKKQKTTKLMLLGFIKSCLLLGTGPPLFTYVSQPTVSFPTCRTNVKTRHCLYHRLHTPLHTCTCCDPRHSVQQESSKFPCIFQPCCTYVEVLRGGIIVAVPRAWEKLLAWTLGRNWVSQWEYKSRAWAGPD